MERRSRGAGSRRVIVFRPFARLALAGQLVGAGLLSVAPAAAKILKTKRPPLPNQYRELALTVGSGIEFETDSEESQYSFPFFVEYGLTNTLTLAVEPDYDVLHRKGGDSISGMGDLETSLTWEFVSERRDRPAFLAEGIVKWPTAAREEFGTNKTDYSLGVIISKEYVRFGLEFNALYTFVGSPAGVKLDNSAEASVALEYHLSRSLDLEAEILTSSSGGFKGKPGTVGGGSAPPELPSAETEGTLGLAEHVSKHLKLEQGGVLKSDGTWQIVAAWEWDFGEGR